LNAFAIFFGHFLPAAVANLASMLPSVPKSSGRLSEAYLSAFLALSGSKNPLNLISRSSYLFILVDGLGTANIKGAGAHAGFLNQKLSGAKSLFAGFPTTTASSLASVATGKQNGEHGFIGYRVFDRSKNRAINLLNDLGQELDPRKYQNLETISELAKKQGLHPVSIGPAEYKQSGFTRATMPDAVYIPAESIEERFSRAIAELRTPGALVYLYIPELDQAAHRFGTTSNQWLTKVEELDSVLSKFVPLLPKQSGAILTADHGVIDVPKSDHIYLEDISALDDLLLIGGDPRVGYLYFPEGSDIEVKKESLTASLAGLVDVVGVADLVKAGWLALFSEVATSLEPDLVLLPRANRVIYHRKFAKAKSMEMIGQHGGMSKSEWEVPLIIF